ncbi:MULTISPECIES: hypothetical protein [Deinococcus]|nr:MULTISPECIES: hypothetical protein [Deinococcus]
MKNLRAALAMLATTVPTLARAQGDVTPQDVGCIKLFTITACWF